MVVYGEHTFIPHSFEWKGVFIDAATLVTTFVQPTDAAGRNIDAGRSGTTITLRAKEYLLKEGERQVDENLSCSGATFTCPKNVGSHTYSATTTFEASSIMFNSAPGIDKGNGVFELPYILSPPLPQNLWLEMVKK